MIGRICRISRIGSEREGGDCKERDEREAKGSVGKQREERNFLFSAGEHANDGHKTGLHERRAR